MTDDTQQKEQKEVNVSPSDYRDFDLAELQVLADYITKNSMPVEMTITEAQHVLQIYMDFLNLSLHNLNLLRSLSGDPMFPIPENKENNNDNA